MKLTFRKRVFLSYFFVIVVPFALAVVTLDRRLEKNSRDEIRDSLLKQALLLDMQIRSAQTSPFNSAQLQELALDVAGRIHARVTVVALSGRVLADSDTETERLGMLDDHSGRPEIAAAFSDGIGESVRYSSTLKVPMMYLAVPIKSSGIIAGAVRLSLPLVKVERILAATRGTIMMSAAVAVLLALLLGALLTRSLLQPLGRIIYTSRKFASGDFSSRVFGEADDEIGELAATLNTMAQDIQDKVGRIEIQNQQLRTIFQSMVEGIVVVDKRTAVLTVNQTVEKIFGFAANEVQNRLFLEVIPNTDLADIVMRVLNEGKYAFQELVLLWPIDKVLQVNGAPIFEDGRVSGCLLVIHDITELRKLEKIRSDFVANVSHELKTPLTSIKGFVETLLDGAVEDTSHAREFLQIIQEHTNRLNNLINDLLDLSYLESREVGIDKKEICLRELVDRVVVGFGAQMKRKGVNASVDIPDGLNVSADPGKMEQVFTNLIDNAIKFNKPNGTVYIEYRDEGPRAKITVIDTGTGIPAKDLPRIFERFYRVDKARSRELGGTGLGLAIVKHIVELHGGIAGVESTEGLGSKFWFTLPK